MLAGQTYPIGRLDFYQKSNLTAHIYLAFLSKFVYYNYKIIINKH